MSKPFRLLAVFAHPDDESFGAAGTLANITDAGGVVTLVCATRGDVGEISDPSLATPETLPQVREDELRAAMAIVGVSDVRVLGYRDSGMAGTELNNDPRAFVNADREVVIRQITETLHDVNPDAVLTFGADGIYGHPDHVVAHEVTTSAVALFSRTSGANPKLYYNTIPRERVLEMAKRPFGPFSKMSEQELAKYGTPAEQITTIIDVSPQFERKLAAIRSHRTQVGPNGPWPDLPIEEMRRFMQYERFRLVNGGGDLADPLLALSLSLVGT